MKAKLKLSISRPSSGGISIRIEDTASLIEFIDASISCEQFAEAITGLSSRPMDAEVRGLEYIGKTRIREPRKIICPIETYDRGILQSWLKENAKEEGWLIDSYLGSQSSVARDGDKTILNYCVHKYVNQDSGE